MPSDSTMLAMVEAVPIVMQWPAERELPCSADMKSASVISPALTISLNFQVLVPEPISCPSYLPLSIGPPDTASEGRSQLAAPISRPGVVLSQPTTRPPPPTELARTAPPPPLLPPLRNRTP